MTTKNRVLATRAAESRFQLVCEIAADEGYSTIAAWLDDQIDRGIKRHTTRKKGMR